MPQLTQTARLSRSIPSSRCILAIPIPTFLGKITAGRSEFKEVIKCDYKLSGGGARKIAQLAKVFAMKPRGPEFGSPITSTHRKAGRHTSVTRPPITQAGGGKDKGIPTACWPASLAQLRILVSVGDPASKYRAQDTA